MDTSMPSPVIIIKIDFDFKTYLMAENVTVLLKYSKYSKYLKIYVLCIPILYREILYICVFFKNRSISKII